MYTPSTSPDIAVPDSALPVTVAVLLSAARASVRRACPGRHVSALDQCEVINVPGEDGVSTLFPRIRRIGHGVGGCGAFSVRSRPACPQESAQLRAVAREGYAARRLGGQPARAASRHSFIARSYNRDTDKLATKTYIVAEFCEGGDLDGQEKCECEGASDDDEFIWRVLMQAVIALLECHSDKKGAAAVAARRPSSTAASSPATLPPGRRA